MKKRIGTNVYKPSEFQHNINYVQEIYNETNNIYQDFCKLLWDFEKQFKIEDHEAHLDTPQRLTKMYLDDLLIGYTQKPEEILNKVFIADNEEMIIMKDIPFVSLCSHHWLPFIGHAHIGYIPDEKRVVGLSKLPKLVYCFSRRFQLQEKMTTEIADSLYNIVKPKGCIIVIKATHLCSQIRSAKTEQAQMVTSAIRGCFNKPEVKQEFLSLLGA